MTQRYGSRALCFERRKMGSLSLCTTGCVPCNDTRLCFARVNRKIPGNKIFRTCGILESSYADGKCPFCKPMREVTKGKMYPYNPSYFSTKRSSGRV